MFEFPAQFNISIPDQTHAKSRELKKEPKAGHGNTLFSRFAIFSRSSCELLTSKCQALEVLT